MLKKLGLALIATIVTMGAAFADVDVNQADQAALDGIKGLGPAKSKLILAERTKNGRFKDWADFQSRVKGIGDKSSTALSQAGLTINGQAKPVLADKAATSVISSSKAVKAVKADATSTPASSVTSVSKSR